MGSGSLIKLVYFARKEEFRVDDNEEKNSKDTLLVSNGGHVLEGKLRFAKFETSKIDDCLEYIHRNLLHLDGTSDFYFLFDCNY